ncbi:MAG: glcF [Gammaproteobacteria bacterium]|nr:glcF [Gammaproteobacteria bacterium]
MQTFFNNEYLQTKQGREADRILRSCVHCGFCTATCPTFLLTGNELDSPRGRIYLIKTMLEGNNVSRITQTHLDRCLTCQSCETACPSGVQYHRLLDLGRNHIEQRIGRSPLAAIQRFIMRKLFTTGWLFASALGLGRLFRPLLPTALKKQIPPMVNPGKWPDFQGPRRMLLLNGCVQNHLSPNTNAAAARVLSRLGIQVITMAEEGCCGAVSYHLNAQEEGLAQARRQVDRLLAHLDDGVEAIISTASGCGNFTKGYVQLLAQDEHYAARAQRLAAYIRDISEILQAEDLTQLQPVRPQRLAFHCPCSLQHGQHLTGAVDSILRQLNITLTAVKDAHLCCGSAGTYSILQPQLAKQLRHNKITALEAGSPDAIATANIGCQSYLGMVTDKPVRHWIEFVDDLFI